MKSARTCSSCGSAFTCGGQACWCSSLPTILPADPAASCLCPDCLGRSIAAAIEVRLKQLDHEQALELAMSQPTRSTAVEHIDYTLEQGRLIFTAWHLLQRGHCCGEGCRHCPYPDAPENV